MAKAQDPVQSKPATGTVVLYFSNGTKQEFSNCQDIREIKDADGEEKIVFTRDGNRYVFKKSQLAGWSLPLLPR
jgi:hypothetical protein